MSARRNVTSTRPRRAALMVALLMAWPLAAAAQTAPAASASSASADMGGMDMGAMPGMPMPAASASGAAPAAAAPARKKPRRKPASPPSKDMEGMKGMHHGHMPMPARPAAAAPASGSMQDMGNMPGMDHGAMPATAQPPAAAGPHDMQRMSDMSGMDHSTANAQPDAGMAGMAGMSMGAMQGGNAPANARSPDYSDGVGYGPMQGMDMADNAPLGMLLIDQLEAFHGYNGNGQTWEAAGWYGNDSNKLWLRSEGDSRRGKVESGDVEAFWNHNIATYWSSQLGVRQDLGVGPGRSWAAFGVEGLAPYWFELEATGYVGSSSRTAARFRANYDLLFTQRLILQPEFEVNLYGKSDPARGIGGGLSDARLGLRLRYEIRRQFAPYIGVVWTRRFGATASFARHDRQAIFDRQWVAGVRIWF